MEGAVIQVPKISDRYCAEICSAGNVARGEILCRRDHLFCVGSCMCPPSQIYPMMVRFLGGSIHVSTHILHCLWLCNYFVRGSKTFPSTQIFIVIFHVAGHIINGNEINKLVIVRGSSITVEGRY